MSETIIAAIIAAGSAVVINIITLISQTNKTHAIIEKEMAVVNVQIETLSKTVEKHNNVVERMYKLEEQNAVQQNQIDTILRTAKARSEEYAQKEIEKWEVARA